MADRFDQNTTARAPAAASHWFMRLAVCLMLIALVFQSGCYYYQISCPDRPPATDFEKRTVWSFAWGIVQQDIQPENCHGAGFSSVRVSTNALFILIAVATLGQAVPMTVQWQCAKRNSSPASGF
jgi:hypothetical protein